tara:strand:- start:269 stop:643 length:375 start_codon:yes stop_codon:yes gene_type:complete
MSFDLMKLLHEEGYIREGEDNLLHAEKAFFAARVMLWIRQKVISDPDFNLSAYLTMLMYYKTDLADLKFSEDSSKLVYRMKNNDREVQELVDALVKSTNKSGQQGSEETTDLSAAENPDRDPES